MKPGTKITRIVMADRDKDDLRINLIRNFKRLGFDEQKVVEAVTSGSVPMYMWMSKWICHNTDYPQTRSLDNRKFMQSFYAWVHYKATAEKLASSDITGEFDNSVTKRKEEPEC